MLVVTLLDLEVQLGLDVGGDIVRGLVRRSCW